VKTALDDSLVAALRRRARRGEIDMNESVLRQLKLRRRRTASMSTVTDAELRLGFELPPSLRELLTRVGNGGFGPGYGFIGLGDRARDDTGFDAVEDYLDRREPDRLDPEEFWPERLVVVCHWGCGIYSCVDCSSAVAPVIRFDPDIVDQDWSIAFGQERARFVDWLRAWVAGEDLFVSGSLPYDDVASATVGSA
jgi:hypothetical protein